MSGFSIEEWAELAGMPSCAKVPEVRYDVYGTYIHYELPGRYRGLDAPQAAALSDALYHDLPGSPCLLTLRKRWVDRAAWEAEDEETVVSGPAPCCDGQCHGPWDCEEYGSRD